MSKSDLTWIDYKDWNSPWEKIEALPGGGQGAAFRARCRSDGTSELLKTIKSRKDPERRARFFREATAYDSFGVDGIPRLVQRNAHRDADPEILLYIATTFMAAEEATRQNLPILYFVYNPAQAERGQLR